MAKGLARIEEIREGIVENHSKCIKDGGKDFGEIFCGHIHELNMPFKVLAEHFEITLNELADITADHIRRL